MRNLNGLNLTAIDTSLKLSRQNIWVTNNLIKRQWQTKLAEHYPEYDFQTISTKTDNPEAQHATITYSFAIKPIDSGFNPADELASINPLWSKLYQSVSSLEYQTALANLTQLDLPSQEMHVTFSAFKNGDFIAPHYDSKPNKTLTQVFYFNHDWHNNWGGYFNLLDKDDHDSVLLSIPPLANYSVILPASQDAWHAVDKLTQNAQQVRQTLQLEWHLKP